MNRKVTCIISKVLQSYITFIVAAVLTKDKNCLGREPAAATRNGVDALPVRREVHVLRQALQRGVEVEVGIPVRHLGEDLGHGTPAKLPGLVGQRAHSVRAKLLQGSKNALEEQGQLGVGAHVALRGVTHVWHPHCSQLRGDPAGDAFEAADPAVFALHKILVVGSFVLPLLIFGLQILGQL